MTLYTENSEKWKLLADIDYFTQFVTAWIPLNAWYRNYYPTLRTDRQAIDEIKNTTNSFRDKAVSLLRDGGQNGASFRSSIGQLHYELERKHIHNRGERLTFEELVVEKNNTSSVNRTHSGIHYRVDCRLPGRPAKEVEIEVLSRAGVRKAFFVQPDGFDLDGLTNGVQGQGLSANQLGQLVALYKEINPRKPINLLGQDPEAFLDMEQFRFVDDCELVAKGTIEMLYLMRNVLFHGEIVPDRDTNKVYEPAYHVLKMLVEAL